jgi:hypothetical protein
MSRTQLEAVDIEYKFEVVLNPLQYRGLQPGYLFFTRLQYQARGNDSQLFIKTEQGCIDILSGRPGLVPDEGIVYLVLRK